MRWIVTRPQPQADEWVQRLGTHGLEAAALPLIAIEAPASTEPVVDAWRTLGSQALVMFVSPNAVYRFFESGPRDPSWPQDTWAGATGPGTVEALRAAGVPTDSIQAPPAEADHFDSEALWRVLQGKRVWQDAAVTVVRGEGGRDWFAKVLQAQGARVRFVEAYRRGVPRLSPAQQSVLAGAVREPSGHVWLFSSSEAIGHLLGLVTAADWAAARAWCTHPRIAERARAAGFGEVKLVPAGFEGLVRTCRCIQSPAP